MEVDHLVYKMMVSLAPVKPIAAITFVSSDASKTIARLKQGSITKRFIIKRSASTFQSIP
jgi:hypothetical protein